MSYNTPTAWANVIASVIPDLFRHTTTDDLLYSLPEEGGDGFTVREHESCRDPEFDAWAPHFVTESEAERWAWGWIKEGDIEEADYYSQEALALTEALEENEWRAIGRTFSSQAQGLVDDDSLTCYNEQLGRVMIRLVNGEEVYWFDTCSEAHMFLCLEDGWGEMDFNVTSSEMRIDDGIYIRYTAN